MIAILGASGHAKVIADCLNGYHFRFVDKEEEKDLPKMGATGLIVGVGDNALRAKIMANVAPLGIPFVAAIHQRAYIAKDATIGPGAVVMAGAVINPGCTIGKGCIVNTRASVDHDSVMGDFSSIAPGATTGGDCRIGSFVAIGLGASVFHGITIGEHSVIGGGSVVTRNVQAHCVAYGVPAKAVRGRAAGERYL